MSCGWRWRRWRTCRGRRMRPVLRSVLGLAATPPRRCARVRRGLLPDPLALSRRRPPSGRSARAAPGLRRFGSSPRRLAGRRCAGAAGCRSTGTRPGGGARDRRRAGARDAGGGSAVSPVVRGVAGRGRADGRAVGRGSGRARAGEVSDAAAVGWPQRRTGLRLVVVAAPRPDSPAAARPTARCVGGGAESAVVE